MSSDLPPFLKLQVITARSLLVDAEVEEVTLPSLEGELGILPGHRPLFTALGRGILAYRAAHKGDRIPVRGGYAEVLPQRVTAFIELGEDENL
jgi:F-type H+-transporting ATPase subunit epsilon